MAEKMLVLSVRLPASVKHALDQAAIEDRRPTANLVSMVLEKWLIAEGRITTDYPAPLDRRRVIRAVQG